jgi:hypothetical protein
MHISMPPMHLRLSDHHADWQKALHGGDDTLLEHLAATEDPASSLLELETYINGIYRSGQHPLFSGSMAELRAQVQWVLPHAESIRARLGWRVRDFDLALLRFIRRSSALSAVLGAGVSMGAGAPSWADLVRLLLEETIDKGLEFYEAVPAEGNPQQPPIELLPHGSVRTGGSGTWRYTQRVAETRRYTAEQEQVARKVLDEVRKKGSSTDVETLMRGAQVCYELCGQHLFRLLTGIIYTRAKGPSATHRVVAELSHEQYVPVRGPGPFPGWDSIITYNFDGLMSEALTEEKVPHAAWAMKGDELCGDPDDLARDSEWYQPIYHVHGYTPKRLFLITNVRFVFSTSQYLTTYKGPRSQILEAVYRGYLGNPVHIALYIGCSFTDEAMNELLRQAFNEYPGRFHYALLKWPRDRKGVDPSPEDMEKESAKYLDFGVRPVWFDDFKEIPELVRQLE